MSQPVVDTLQICDALRKTGMEREQAEGLARTLGKELGAYVAVKEDVQSGFRQIRSDLGADIQKVRSDLGADIQQVRNDLGARIQAVDTKVEVLSAKMEGLSRQLTFVVAGFGLMLGILTVASGMGVFDRSPAPSQAVIESRSP